MNVLLIQPPNTKNGLLALSGQEIPLSLCYLASSLQADGFDRVRVIDFNLVGGSTQDWERSLRHDPPDLVGLTSYTHNTQMAYRLARRIKELFPDAVTILGGFHASALPGRTLEEEPALDFVAVGEGETTIVELARALSSGKSTDGIDGLVRRGEGGPAPWSTRHPEKNLDALPFPDRTLLPVTSYRPDPGNYYQLPSTGILFSRGCPYHCTYCSKSVFLDSVRFRSPANFLAEVAECGHRWGIHDFRLEDEGPTVAPQKLAALCEAIIERRVDITWNCFSRVDRVDEVLLALMRRAGCYHITYGVESTDDAELKKLRKRIRFEQARDAVVKTQRHGIETKLNFILGFPWQDAEDCRKTVRSAIRSGADLASFNVFKPLPGSPLFAEMDAQGLLKAASWEDYSIDNERLLFDAAYTEEEIREIVRWANLAFYFRPATILKRIGRWFRHPVRETRTILQGLIVLTKMAFQTRGPRVTSALAANSGA